MGRLVRAFSRLFLHDIDPSYAVPEGEQPLYIDVRLGFNNAEQRRLNELGEVQRPEFEARYAAAQAKEPIPPFTDAWYEADNAIYAVYSAGTNVTETLDADGNVVTLPPATEPRFWEHMTADVKAAVIARFNAESDARAARLSGEDFTKPPAGSS